MVSDSASEDGRKEDAPLTDIGHDIKAMSRDQLAELQRKIALAQKAMEK